MKISADDKVGDNLHEMSVFISGRENKKKNKQKTPKYRLLKFLPRMLSVKICDSNFNSKICVVQYFLQ